jgi:hypothetical protein
MSNNIYIIVLSAMLSALCVSAEAQQPKKVPRIGYVSATDPVDESSRAEAIRLALRELGYKKDRTSPSSTDMRRGSKIGILSLQPSWCDSRLISSW